MFKDDQLKEIFCAGLFLFGAAIGELMLQGFRLNGYLLLGTIFALLAIAIAEQKSWWLITIIYAASLYFFSSYPLIVSLAVVLTTTLIALWLNRAISFTPLPFRRWLVIITVPVWHLMIITGASALHLIYPYSITLGVLNALSAIAVSALLISATKQSPKP